MIIVRLLSPERSWLVGNHQSLLGYRSRHCHGINYTHRHFSATSLSFKSTRAPAPSAPQIFTFNLHVHLRFRFRFSFRGRSKGVHFPPPTLSLTCQFRPRKI